MLASRQFFCARTEMQLQKRFHVIHKAQVVFLATEIKNCILNSILITDNVQLLQRQYIL